MEFRITVEYDNDPERTITGIVTDGAGPGWFDRDCALCIRAPFRIESVSGPRYRPEGHEDDDSTVWEDDWDTVLTPEGRAAAASYGVSIIADADGFAIDLYGCDTPPSVRVSAPIERYESPRRIKPDPPSTDIWLRQVDPEKVTWFHGGQPVATFFPDDEGLWAEAECLWLESVALWAADVGVNVLVDDPEWIGYERAGTREASPVVSLLTYLSEEAGRLGHTFQRGIDALCEDDDPVRGTVVHLGSDQPGPWKYAIVGVEWDDARPGQTGEHRLAHASTYSTDGRSPRPGDRVVAIDRDYVKVVD